MIELIVSLTLSADFAIPYPWLEYCHKDPRAACEVENLSAQDVAKLNKVVNDAITPLLDPTGDDVWEAFPEERAGDCEDYALTKRAALLALGFDGPMWVVLGRATQDGRTEDHVVLEVEVEGRVWVLDNLAADFIYPTDDRPYAWTLTARQAHNSASWALK